MVEIYDPRTCGCTAATHEEVHKPGECPTMPVMRIKIGENEYDACGRCFGHAKKLLGVEAITVISSGVAYATNTPPVKDKP
jgi:hypothetical protein